MVFRIPYPNVVVATDGVVFLPKNARQRRRLPRRHGVDVDYRPAAKFRFHIYIIYTYGTIYGRKYTRRARLRRGPGTERDINDEMYLNAIKTKRKCLWPSVEILWVKHQHRGRSRCKNNGKSSAIRLPIIPGGNRTYLKLATTAIMSWARHERITDLLRDSVVLHIHTHSAL